MQTALNDGTAVDAVLMEQLQKNWLVMSLKNCLTVLKLLQSNRAEHAMNYFEQIDEKIKMYSTVLVK